MTDRKFRDPSDLATLDDFLDEDGIRGGDPTRGQERDRPPFQQAMKAQGLSRTAMAAEMETSRAQLNRGWTPEASDVTLDTLSRAARVLGRELKVELA